MLAPMSNVYPGDHKRMQHQPIGNLQAQLKHPVAQCRDPKGNLFAHRWRREHHFLEIGFEISPAVRLKAFMGAAHDVPHRAHGVPQMSHQFIFGQAVGPHVDGQHSGTQTQNEAALAHAVEIHREHGGFERTAGCRDGDAGGNPHAFCRYGGNCERHEGRCVDLQCRHAVKADVLHLLRACHICQDLARRARVPTTREVYLRHFALESSKRPFIRKIRIELDFS